MADIQLKYLTDLESATSASPDDLLHINQDGNDRSVTVQILCASLAAILHPVGKVEWFANNTNPNSVFPGQTWSRVPGQGKTVRLANSSGSDVFQQGGSDEVTLTEANMAPHNHPIDLNTESYDFGVLNTGSGGAHVHNFKYKRNGKTTDASTDPSSDVMKTSSGANQESRATESAGSHSHPMSIPPHYHKVNGDTGSKGGGKPVSVANAYIKLAAWYRIS